MKKYIIGFVVGLVVTSGLLIPVFIQDQNNKIEFGRKIGFTEGLIFSSGRLEKEFGAIKTPKNYKRIFSVKTTDVIVFEVDGIKTVRVIN